MSLLLSSLALNIASAAQVQFAPSQQILMQGSSCHQLGEFGQSIMDWTTTINTSLVIAQPECFCSTQSCQMDVSQISPYFVIELTSFQETQSVSAFNGPNCFNAALYASATLPNVSFTHPYELTALLQSSLCTERKADEELQPGDMLVVRDQSDSNFEIHAGVYLNDQLSFSKYGESKVMPYTYGLNVHQSYGVRNEQCARIEGLPAPGAPCYHKPFVNYYKCTAMSHFISRVMNQEGGITEPVRALYARAAGYDHKISRIAFKGGAFRADEIQPLQTELANLYADTLRVSVELNLNKENRELLRLTHFHIFSLYEQTRRIAVGLGKIELAKSTLDKPSLH